MIQEQKYHHDNLKAELTEKGLKLLDEEGYEGFSLRKVAKACNVSHTAPYRHFRDKDELILAIASEAMNKFSNALQQAVAKHPDKPGNQLKEMGCAYVSFFMQNPEYLRLFFLSDIAEKINNNAANAGNYEYLSDRESYGNPFGIFSKTVESNLKNRENEVDPEEKAELVLYCWGLVHGISILIAKNEFPYQGDYMELVRKILWKNNVL